MPISPDSEPPNGQGLISVITSKQTTAASTPQHGTPTPVSLQREITPPPTGKRKSLSVAANGKLETGDNEEGLDKIDTLKPVSDLAAIEAGKKKVRNHVAHFSTALAPCVRPNAPLSLMSIDDWISLYQSNLTPAGHHFIIHQHDHPIAGTHYDLRLQFSQGSSCSWAIPFGVPGNVNSRRQTRQCMETRVHNYWNHLIESASHATGSLLVWDTGEYEILPHKSEIKAQLERKETADSQGTDPGPQGESRDDRPENEKLISAFQNCKIKLRLHGHKLPKNYTVNMWVASDSDHRLPSARRLPMRKRRRLDPEEARRLKEYEDEMNETASESGSDTDGRTNFTLGAKFSIGTSIRGGSMTALYETPEEEAQKEIEEREDEETRHNNAYPGASNTIGSVHQRKWFMGIAKEDSGFVKKGKSPAAWVRRRDENGQLLGWDPFFVHGAEGDKAERSVVTGRTSAEVFADEGVVGFKRRKGWQPILQ
jgi:hypothetical protein